MNKINDKKTSTPTNEKAAMSKVRISIQLGIFILILAAILMLAAGRWNWIMGWIYIAMYASLTTVSLFIVPLDPELVEERTQIKEGVKEWDKTITVIGSVLYPLAILVVAGLDERFGWSSQISLSLQIAALCFATLGNLISIWATAVNKFYSRFVRIQKERNHVVIADGPYRYVRHPGYIGQIIFSVSSALALGSIWALIPGGLFALLLIVRTLLEDRTLIEELDGYKEYTRIVRYRLVPGIW